MYLKKADVPGQIAQDIADDIGVRISKGNNKLDWIPNLSLLPEKTCPGRRRECKWCYAKACIRYSTWAKVRWSVNTFYAMNNLRRFEADVKAHVYLARTLYFRLHVGGDFFSQEYLNCWFRICRAIPDTKFLAFTKSFEFDYSKKPENLNIIWSVFPSTEFDDVPAGPRHYTEFDQLRLYYPPSEGARLKKALRCIGSCTKCGMCFHVDENGVDVKCRAHGSAFKNVSRGANGRFLSREEVR